MAGMVGLSLSACTVDASADVAAPASSVTVTANATTTIVPTTPPTTATTTTTPPTTTTTTSTPPTTTSTLPSPSTSSASTSDAAEGEPFTPIALSAAVESLVADNTAVSVTVRRDGEAVYRRATGATVSGQPLTTDSPMVLASVSKLITALTVARLVEGESTALTARLPWSRMAIEHHPGWDDVVVAELLTHTAGMPAARSTWFDDPGSCAVPLQEAMAEPPTSDRGTWVYSNGNYCALGLLIEHLTGHGIDLAADEMLFEPLGITGPHLTTDRQQGTDGPYDQGTARLERLGGAGAWMASSDDVAELLASVTATDRVTLAWPGVIVDQYGWGHTGTIDGAKACAWVIEGGRTTVVAIVAGNRPATGGKVCDVVIPALAADLGVWAGKPVRNPD